MHMLNNYRTYIFLLGIMIFTISCKRDGCTDKVAINFDITAEKDDGSCDYCELQSEVIGMHPFFIYDYNSESPYYTQAIAKCDVIQIFENYNSSICGETGCFLEAEITNLTKHHIEDFSFILYINPTNTFLTFIFTSYDEASGDLTIAKDSTIRVVNATLDNNNSCESISGASGNANLFSISYTN